MTKMFIVIDIRDDSICWQGTREECRQWLSGTAPYTRAYYRMLEVMEKEAVKQ